MRPMWRRRATQAVLLVLLLVVSGMALGLVLAYPVSKVRLSEAAAIQLDQAALAGKVDPEQALVTTGDVGGGWQPGDERLATFGLFGAPFCGERVDLPEALSPVRSSVLVDPARRTTLISQAVRTDRWQNARQYVGSVDRAISGCDRFYVTGPDGRDLQRVLEESGTRPVDDYASRVYLSEDGRSSVAWSLFSVGDVVVAVQFTGPNRPPEGFLDELESKLLLRLAPEAFAPGGVVDDTVPTTTTAPVAGGTPTTVVEGGSADESEGG